MGDIVPYDASGLPCKDDSHLGEHLKMIQSAITQQWVIPVAMRTTLVMRLQEIISDPEVDDRARVNAIKCVQSMARDNADAYIALDKIVRLDKGGATEVVKFGPIEL